ncbi:MAG: DUF4382 domain-containing protein [Prolixibacteraceae bacterium]|jgi:hypothetical protein|nr:DUF4382 domain-containing protein [Prolixibacteraceae bacterium]
MYTSRTIKITMLIKLSFIALLVLLLSSCNKDDESSHLTVLMTDAPGNYNAVMIDLQGVEVTGNAESIVQLNTNTGIYNLLDFSNGIDTLLATGDLNAGNVSQIRLILGANNTVMVDGIVYPLSTPSAMQSGLKLQVHQTFQPGVSYSILLDFDANQSIVLTGNNEYKLKPVIRVIDEAISGSIRGSITPIGTKVTVTVQSNEIGYSSMCNENGAFMIRGLPSGVYELTITPDLPLLPVTIESITVAVGESNNLGIIAL